ncbi:serine protease persephone-like [Hylaeus anthracinus]|uniref:serine protease persephone-like n=1 Tax=Hylaeus anthracinus TaxID=313031 RepID=UPI0023B9E35B|nr:serine protease persephone-like [Hylaeus anthracinus]
MLSHPFVSAVISFLLILSVAVSCSARDEGDACTADNAPGICKRLQNCPSVYEELLKGNVPRESCGYAGFEPIVCCPNGEATTTTTTQRTTPTGAPVTSRGPLDGWGVVAKSKCEKYAGSVYANVVSPVLSTKVETVNISLCVLKTQKLIVGGKKADPKEFPHMAAVGYDTGNGNIEWSCGGTLISERFVLTAAHCLYNMNWQAAASWVRLGDLNLQRMDDDAKPQDIKIITRIRHPKYKRPSQYHDIGLLEMEKDVVFDAWIRPSCLPYSLPDTDNNDKATATGWGRVDWNEDEGSSDLLKVTISLVSQSVCNRSFGSDPVLQRGIVDEWQICAGDLGKDTCQGDSGGPLTIRNSDYDCMYSVIGVTSLGRLCGSSSPGVYTRVYNYIPWIESTVWPNS